MYWSARVLVALSLAIVAAPLGPEAQPAAKIPRIGVVVPVEPESPEEPNIGAFRQTLRDLGYVDGQKIAVDYRYARGKSQLYGELASQLVRLNVGSWSWDLWHPQWPRNR